MSGRTTTVQADYQAATRLNIGRALFRHGKPQSFEYIGLGGRSKKMSIDGPCCSLVVGCDDRYAFAAAVALVSALSRPYAPESLEIVILCDGVSSEARDRLYCVTNRLCPRSVLRFVDVPCDEVCPFPTSRHITTAAYLRVFVARYLAPATRRVVYMDVDTLVLANIRPLFEVDLHGGIVGACRDYIRPEMPRPGRENNGFLDGAHRTESEHYFNSGLLVVDVDRWRERDVEARALEFARQHPDLIADAHDQELLNIVLAGDWTPLEPEWNVCSELFFIHGMAAHPYRTQLLRRRKEITANARIVHFTGQPKPWQHWCMHPYVYAWVWAYMRSGWGSPISRGAWVAKWAVKHLWVRVNVWMGRFKNDMRMNDVAGAVSGDEPLERPLVTE
jgi:lipopolysaccharide biosynthesis glycosyltransferase